MEDFLGLREMIPALLILFIFLQIDPISAQLNLHVCSSTSGNYTQNSTFHSNLNSILKSVSTDINTTNGFYHGSAGNGVDQVNAMANCRPDVDIGTCRGCVNDAARNLTSLYCPNQKEAIQWLEVCMFRYSNNPILGIMSLSPGYKLYNINNASNVNLYSRQLISLADNLTKVASNGSPRKYASIKSNDPNTATVYGFMVCTPDLTPGDCNACLSSIADELSKCCYTHLGADFLTPSCIYRFESYPILNVNFTQPPPPPPLLPLPPSPTPLPPLQLPAGPPPTHHKGRSNAIVITVVCVIVGLFVVTLIAACVFFYKKRSQKTSRSGHRPNEEEEALQTIADSETREYDFALIKAVTNDFSSANLLGNGGFGDVYKGVFSNGKEIAVKRLSKSSVQGEKEFLNEVILLAKLQHKCLVRLLGFCLEQTERLLIYEFMRNGSLDKFLFDADTVNRSKLDWGDRYKIITNVAKGLLYLHEESRLMIIHRDLKASNILLDEDMNAKISDFGTARLFVLDKSSEANTTIIAGTRGYMAPEYAIHGFFSVKSDVYSYGVLLLEILSGKKNCYSPNEESFEGLLSYAYKTWKYGRALDVIDPMLMAHSYSQEIIIRCIHIALLCVQENVASRPTMATVVLMLQSSTVTMPLPSEPGFFSNTRTWLSDIYESTSSSNQTKSISAHGGAQNDTSLKDDETDSYLYPR